MGDAFSPHIGISSLFVKYKQVACLQIALQVSEASLSSISSDNGVRRAVLYYNDLPNSPRILGVEKKKILGQRRAQTSVMWARNAVLDEDEGNHVHTNSAAL